MMAVLHCEFDTIMVYYDVETKRADRDWAY